MYINAAQSHRPHEHGLQWLKFNCEDNHRKHSAQHDGGQTCRLHNFLNQLLSLSLSLALFESLSDQQWEMWNSNFRKGETLSSNWYCCTHHIAQAYTCVLAATNLIAKAKGRSSTCVIRCVCVCVSGLPSSVNHRMFLNHSWPHRISQSFTYKCQSTFTPARLITRLRHHSGDIRCDSRTSLKTFRPFTWQPVSFLSHSPVVCLSHSSSQIVVVLFSFLLPGYVFNPDRLCASSLVRMKHFTTDLDEIWWRQSMIQATRHLLV